MDVEKIIEEYLTGIAHGPVGEMPLEKWQQYERVNRLEAQELLRAMHASHAPVACPTCDDGIMRTILSADVVFDVETWSGGLPVKHKNSRISPGTFRDMRYQCSKCYTIYVEHEGKLVRGKYVSETKVVPC